MNKWYDIIKATANAKTTKVMLYDEIGGWGKSAKDFVAELDAIKTPRIDLHINSYGGEIIDGLACYNAIKSHAAEVTTHIDGLAASISSVIALAGDKVRIAKNAFVMIHNGWGLAMGDPAEMRKQADVLEKLCGSIASAYAEKTGKSVEDVRAAMDAETWFTASEAKEWGLVDKIDDDGDEDKLASSALLAVAKYQKAPPALRKFAASAARSETPKTKEPKMEKLTLKDGKFFVGENEVDATEYLASLPKPAAAPDTEKLVAQARAEGVKAEREYRAMFNTVVATAKLDAKASAEFEKEFYGRNEADLKFLASHAIGTRAQALGEQAPGNGEGEQLTPEAKAEKDMIDAATKRFASEPKVRSMFGLSGEGPDAPAYKAALARYLDSERRYSKQDVKPAAK